MTLAVGLSVVVYRMPIDLALLSALHGALYGVFPISWVVYSAVLLYQITVRTGRFEVIKQSVASLTDDRRLQTLLIAFSFGAFLEGAAGFGAPVAISAGMLVGLGFDPYYAAGLCLIANTAPVAFGSIGIPLITASQVTGVDLHALSQMVGRQLPLLSLIVPFYLVAADGGLARAARRLAGGARLGRDLRDRAMPDGESSSGRCCPTSSRRSSRSSRWCCCCASGIRPQSFRFASEPAQTTRPAAPPLATALSAWAPLLILTLMVGSWGVKSVQALVDQVTMRVPVPALDGAIVNPDTGRAIAAIFRFNWLGASGTAVCLAALLSAAVVGAGWRLVATVRSTRAGSSRGRWRRSPHFLAFAYVSSASGMTTTLGRALAANGRAVSVLLAAARLARRVHHRLRHVGQRAVRTAAAGVRRSARPQSRAHGGRELVGRRDGEDDLAAVDRGRLRGDGAGWQGAGARALHACRTRSSWWRCSA